MKKNPHLSISSGGKLSTLNLNFWVFLEGEFHYSPFGGGFPRLNVHTLYQAYDMLSFVAIMLFFPITNLY